MAEPRLLTTQGAVKTALSYQQGCIARDAALLFASREVLPKICMHIDGERYDGFGKKVVLLQQTSQMLESRNGK
jgi:hypothetical protein